MSQHRCYKTIYSALIQPYFDYCSALWDTCNKTLKDKLQKYQNTAARIIAGASYEIRSADILQALEWENLESRRIITKDTLMYKILNDYSAPTHLLQPECLHLFGIVQTLHNLAETQVISSSHSVDITMDYFINTQVHQFLTVMKLFLSLNSFCQFA